MVEETAIHQRPNYKRLTGNPYLDCRFSPFSLLQTRAGPPDGIGRRTLIRDWKPTFDFVADTYTRLRISPAYPFPLKVYSTGSVTCNTTLLNTGQLSSQWGAVPATGAMSADWPGAQNVSPQKVSSARVISVGYRLMYTGPATSAEGLLVADDVGFKVDGYTPNNSFAITYLKNDGTTVTIAANNAGFVNIDEFPMNVKPTATSSEYVGRPEAGVEGVLKSQTTASNGKFQSWYGRGVMSCYDQDPAGATRAASLNQASTPVTIATPGYSVVDDNFMAAGIEITQGGKYRLELVFCMEQELEPDNPLLDMAKPPPLRDIAVLELADYFDSVMTPRPFGENPFGVILSNPSRKGPRSRRRRRQRQPPKRRNRRKTKQGRKGKGK